MNNLVRSSPTNVSQSHNSAVISDRFDRSLDQLTIEIAERPSKKRGLRSKLLLRPSIRSKVENAFQDSPSGKEKPLQTAANGVPSPYTRAPIRPLLAEHLQPPSELGNESSTNLAEPMKHTFSPLKLVNIKRRDSTRSTAGKATSTKSRPQTPTPSDPNGTPETSFDGQLGSPQAQTPLSDPTLPRLTSKSTPPVPSTPPTKAARSPIPQRPSTPPFNSPPPPRLLRKSVKQSFNPLKLVTMKQKDSTKYSAGKAGSTKSRPQTPALSDPNGTPKTSFVPPPLPVTHVQRTPPRDPQDSTMPSSPGFDPRSSTYQYIRSAIDFSDPSVPELIFPGGSDIAAASAPTEQESLDRGGDVAATHGYEYEENEGDIGGEEAQSGHERSISFSVLTRTLSEASRGALAMFGTGDTHRKLLRKHHQRTDSTASNEAGEQETMGGAEKGVWPNLREDIMTNDGLEDGGDRVSTDERKAIFTEPIPPSSSPRSTSPTSQPLSAFLTHQSSFCLNSPPRSPAPIGRRTASPPLIGAPVLSQAPTITTTALPPTEDATRSTSVSFPPPSPSGAQTISSILFPIRKHLASHRVSQSNGSTADIAATAFPSTDRSDVLCTASPQPAGSVQPPHESAISPPPLPVLPQSQSPTTAPSSKSRFPTFGVAGGTPTSGSMSTSRERDRGGFRIGQDFLGLKKKLRWIRKKDSGNVGDAGSVHVVNSSDWESPRYAAPTGEVPSNSATLDGVKAAVALNLSGDEIPPESVQMPVPMTMPQDPRTSSVIFSGRDDERLDLGNQHLGRLEGGFHSDLLQRPNAPSGERNSKAMLPARSSINTARASLASSNGSGSTTPVDEDPLPWTRSARASRALRPPSPQASTFLSVTPLHHNQALHPIKNRGDALEKEKASRRSRNIPFIDVTAGRSIRTGLGTASSTAWSDKGESSAATTKAPSERAADKSFQLEDGEMDRYYGVHRYDGYDGHPLPPIQHPREPSLTYTPTSAEIDEIESILRPTLDDLASLYVRPSRLTKLPSSEIGL
ncbi:hypothetical protein FRC00_000359, partial [Tulasnella sp. 408]